MTGGLLDATHAHAVYATRNSVVAIHLDTKEKKEFELAGAATVFNGTLFVPGEQAAVFYSEGSHESPRIAVLDLGDLDASRHWSHPFRQSREDPAVES